MSKNKKKKGYKPYYNKKPKTNEDSSLELENNDHVEEVDEEMEEEVMEEDNKPLNENLFVYDEKDEYKVIAVRFINVGKKYFFDPRDIDLKIGE